MEDIRNILKNKILVLVKEGLDHAHRAFQVLRHLQAKAFLHLPAQFKSREHFLLRLLKVSAKGMGIRHGKRPQAPQAG